MDHSDVALDQEGVLPPLSRLPADGWRVDSREEGEEGEEELWIHWKDPYWKEFDSRTPLPETTTTTTVPWPGGGGEVRGNGSRADLLEANRDAATHLVPLLLLLALALLLTVVGNALVCLVYRTRFRRNTANLYVVYLAGLGLALAGLGVPMEMSTLALPLLFQSSAACKAVRYVQTASVCSVLLALTVVAADRFRTRTRSSCARRLCAGSLVLGLCLALPAVLLFGDRAVATDLPGVRGVACGVDNDMKAGVVAFVYITLLSATFLVAVVTITLLYVLIFLRTRRTKSAAVPQVREGASPKARDFPRKHRFVAENSSSSLGSEETRKLSAGGLGSSGGGGGGASSTPRSSRDSPGLDPARVPLRGKESARIGGSGGARTSLDVRSVQMTWIFFVVSVVTLISVAPFVVFRALEVMTPLLDELKLVGAVVVWQVCVRLYLLHPPLLPLVYLLSNRHFRREAKVLVQRVGLPCRRSSPDRAARPAR